ncbi:translocase of chloroplast 159 chloroplastic [Phtheirospermum japonicum]|uniref:Translocase of chloroplast 159 chloroplastic n=1 Tax=Phtheirospermum japonicum TaxID=374723 RepID=A0A830CKL5_9LAMI|nr:translocase of chloroplast 159 chloroplastic [Phtheirospermum japonicum]
MMLLLEFPVFGFAEIEGMGANPNWGKELEKLSLEVGFSWAKHYETGGGLMDGPDGYPLSYDEFIAQQSQAVQQLIGQSAVMNDGDLMIPLLVLALAVIGSHPNGHTALDGFAL